MKMDYRVVFSQRKSIAVVVTEEAEILVKAPCGYSQKRIREFLTAHEEWIRCRLAKMQEQKEELGPPLTEEEKQLYRKRAQKILPEKTAFYAEKLGVTFGKISIREQKTRWGSCSSKGNLNFNWRLMLAPDEVIDYVVVHELAHRKEMNHSKAFYQIVESVFPDYKNRQKWLKEQGFILWR